MGGRSETHDRVSDNNDVRHLRPGVGRVHWLFGLRHEDGEEKKK